MRNSRVELADGEYELEKADARARGAATCITIRMIERQGVRSNFENLTAIATLPEGRGTFKILVQNATGAFGLKKSGE